jgi:arylformamidase
MELIDLTRTLAPRMPVYPGDPDVQFAAHADHASHGYRVTEVRLGTHAGTHLDAPAHFLEGGRTVEELPLAALVGPARMAWLEDAPRVTAGERVLLRSGWGSKWGESGYFEGFPALPDAWAKALASAPAALVGLETPSLHREPGEDARLHRLLLGAGVVIVENLANLDRLPERVFLAALPLPLRGLDGAPCRVIAIPAADIESELIE